MKIKTKSAETRLLPTLVLCVAAGTLVAFSAQASADTYHVVVPAPGKAAPYAAIQLELSPASLPAGWVGDPYVGFDFNAALRITGDSALDMSQVSWSAYSGSLPKGLALTKEGSVVGTPTDVGTSSFQVRAKYKTKAAVGTYAVGVKMERHLVEQAGVRSWEDGTFAQSCKDYFQPTYPYVYAGATGDGVYRIAPGGGIEPFDVRCDMTAEGGGWTLVEYASDLPLLNRFTDNRDVFRWTPGSFSLKLSDAQISAVRSISVTARQRYVGLCVGVVHYYYINDNPRYLSAVGFRFHTGVETNHGQGAYSPGTISVIQDGCKANGGEGGRLETATIFDIENINLPIVNIGTVDSGSSNEKFGSPLTQYPARFR